MGFKSSLIKPFASFTARRLKSDLKQSQDLQNKWFRQLISKAAATTFGRDHHFGDIQGYDDFKQAVPIRDYEALRPYVDKIISGESDVLWPGKPRYFAKTSGTTSGVKYIPISRDSIPNHIGSARNALFNYSITRNNGSFFDGKMIFLSGSPVLDQKGGINTGRLSGIVNHLVPGWIRSNQLPSYETNCIDDWEEKLDAIISETKDQDMRLISGIPPWVQMYFERLLEVTGKRSVIEIFPNFSLFVHGGVNYAPYEEQIMQLIGKQIDTLETYPASEGFIAYQDSWPDQGLRLNVNSGIFFEFVPLSEFHSENPPRYSLQEVQPDIDYAVIINSNAGLWAYNIGDTVSFSSVDPPRLKVTGRVKHFISAFGEHVIGKEIDQSMTEACRSTGAVAAEFTVAPQVNPDDDGPPYHEWFIEFSTPPGDLEAFRQALDKALVDQNIYYQDLIEGGILRQLKVTEVVRNGFHRVMERDGKLGGQNKIPRLMNDRTFVQKLDDFIQSV